MIATSFYSSASNKLRLAGIALALSAAVLCGAGNVSAWFSETPIVIGDGSLFMRSSFPWQNDGHAHHHPHPNSSVTGVDVQLGAAMNSIAVNREKCTVVVTYKGSHSITVSTDERGQKLEVDTDFGRFRRGASDDELRENDDTVKITGVRVTHGGQTQNFQPDAAGGHTTVTIHYR
jgi:hypothetical protein